MARRTAIYGLLAIAFALLLSRFLPNPFQVFTPPETLDRALSLNGIANLMVAGSWLFLGWTLRKIVRRHQPHLPFRWVWSSFYTFIMICGAARMVDATTYWTHMYWLRAYANSLAGVASIVPAVILPTLLPRVDQLLRTEKAYNESREGRLLLVNKLACIAYYDYDPGSDVITWLDPSADLFGVPLEQVRTREQRMSFLHSEDRAQVEERFDAALEGEPYDVEYRIIHASGEVRWMSGTGMLFHNDDGSARHFLGVIQDITDRKRAEVALVESEKIAATGRLAAMITHEINNPLDAASNCLYLARMQDGGVSAGTAMLLQAENELHRIAQIIRSTLSFYRESRSPQAVNITALLDEVLCLHSALIRRRSLEVVTHYQPGEILAFPGELHQIFNNLIRNAIEAAPLKGRVIIEIAMGDNMASIAVEDNGPGIPEALQGKLFEPFFTTKGEKGTGIGLWVTRGLVTKNGGRIEFRSQPGQPTRFVVYLPLSPNAMVDPKV